MKKKAKKKNTVRVLTMTPALAKALTEWRDARRAFVRTSTNIHDAVMRCNAADAALAQTYDRLAVEASG